MRFPRSTLGLAAAGVAALLLVACGAKQEAAPAPEAAPPATASAPEAAAPTDAKTITDAARSTQESVGETPDTGGDAALQRLAPMPESAQLPGGKWKSGVNYQPVVPAQTTSAEPGQVEVIEFFWLGCAHCYALEPFIENWEKSKPAYVKFVRVHVMWGPAHRAHARLFYTLEALGKGDLLGKAFDEIHKRNNFLAAADEGQGRKLQLAWAKSQGISEADFNREYDGFAVTTRLQRGEELNKRYNIDSVPQVIVNGKYRSDITMAGGQKELIDLINDLAAFEKSR